MTRYEAYLNLYYAVLNKSQTETGNNKLKKLIDCMNPFFHPLEASKDIYIYDRFKELWLSEGSMYTPNTDNYGFTFAKKFFKSLPKTDERFQAGLEALSKVTQAEWEEAAQWQAVSGTYELLYYLLLEKVEQYPELKGFLDRMNPFSDSTESFSKDPEVADKYFAIAYAKPHYEVNYDLAGQFIDNLNLPYVTAAFKTIKESEWEKVRTEQPHIFRTSNK